MEETERVILGITMGGSGWHRAGDYGEGAGAAGTV